MSERKVLNKYYPPDFDPSKIPRLRLPKDRQYTVRLMAPCNMRCTTCGEYIYKGKKFNARKETVQNEEYLGIKIFRFYIKCPRCLAEITFKTDPQNADYIVENGASRNFQALKLAEEQAEREAKEQEEEEKSNPMKLLENRTKASKQEMELLESLAELKDLNQRHAQVDFDQMLGHYAKHDERLRVQQEEEDEAFIREVFGQSENKSVKREAEDSDSGEEIIIHKALKSDTLTEKPKSEKVADTDTKKSERPEKSVRTVKPTNPLNNLVKPKKSSLALSNLVKIKAKDTCKQTTLPDTSANNTVTACNSLSLLGMYAGDSDSSD